MDGLQSAKKNKDAGIVVVGATNRVRQLTISLKPIDLNFTSSHMIWMTLFFGDSQLG
jgi:hypothetical protein